MVNGKHVRLPGAHLRALTDDLQLQAVVDGVAISIISTSNGDGTVDVTWTVTPASKPAPDPDATSSTDPAPRTSAPTPLAALHDQLVAAAQKFGVDQVLLAGIAYAESSLDPTAKSRSSSAFGLFQFLDATWSTVVAQFGSPLNISVSDRNDIAAQCLMGAAALHSNQSALQARLGRARPMRNAMLPTSSASARRRTCSPATARAVLATRSARLPRRSSARTRPSSSTASRSGPSIRS